MEFYGFLRDLESRCQELCLSNRLIRPKPALTYHEPLDTHLIAQIGPKHGFVLARLPLTRQPYLIFKEIEFIPTRFTLDALQSANEDLFAGTNPAVIRGRLEDLEQSMTNLTA